MVQMSAREQDPYTEAWRKYKRGDAASAIEIYEGLAKEGDVHAVVLLGTFHARGLGVPVDLNRAEDLFKQAAALGSAEAVFQMSTIWMDRGDMQRYFLAIQEAANMDLLVARFYLGLCYRRGRGVAIDKSQGEALIREAADRGLMRAKINLAWRRILRIHNPVGFAYGLIKLPLVILEFLTIAAINPDDERLR